MKKKKIKKAKNIYLTREFLKSRENTRLPVQKWILFSYYFLDKGYKIQLYEARFTFSKYLTLIKGEKSCKVRFSNHKPIRSREENKDCDFFVGVTNLQVSTAHDVAIKVLEFFGEKRNVKS